MPGQNSRHNQLIARAMVDGWQTHGWKAAIRKVLADPSWAGDHREHVEDSEEIGILFERVTCIPDAWRIRIEHESEGWLHSVLVLEFLEIEVTHQIDDRKLSELEQFWFALDATEYFHFRVLRMDRIGNLASYLDFGLSLEALGYLYGPGRPFGDRPVSEAPSPEVSQVDEE